jgi:hypothetical protein
MAKKKDDKIRIVGFDTGDIILEVKTARYYCIPKHLQASLDFYIEDWFYRHDIHSPHAGRDAHEIGYSERVDSVEEISYEHYEWAIVKKIEQKKNLKDRCQWCRKGNDDVREIELRWGVGSGDDLPPLRYKVCADCRQNVKGWFRYRKEEKND